MDISYNHRGISPEANEYLREHHGRYTFGIGSCNKNYLKQRLLATPTLATVCAAMNTNLLPFISASGFMTNKPRIDPMYIADWMKLRSVCCSQYKPA